MDIFSHRFHEFWRVDPPQVTPGRYKLDESRWQTKKASIGIIGGDGFPPALTSAVSIKRFKPKLRPRVNIAALLD